MNAIGLRQLLILLASASLVAIGYLGLVDSLSPRPTLFAGILLIVALQSFAAGQRRETVIHRRKNP